MPSPPPITTENLYLSVVIPVFNERETIEAVLKRVAEVPIRKQVIVVDDGSMDGTRDRLQRLQKENRLLDCLVLRPLDPVVHRSADCLCWSCSLLVVLFLLTLLCRRTIECKNPC